MSDFAKEKKCPDCPVPEYMATYGDMVTLLLCFFVLLMNPKTIDSQRMQLIMATFNKIGVLTGGNTLQKGELAELGNTLVSLPSTTPLQRLNKSRDEALSVFKTESDSEKIIVTQEERGLVISLAGDFYFEPGRAELNMEEARPTLGRLVSFLTTPELQDQKIRVEGHTDASPPDPAGNWATNWELSAARAANVLHYLSDLGIDERNYQIAGFADVSPPPDIDLTTSAGQARQRRVDIVILKEGHL